MPTPAPCEVGPKLTRIVEAAGDRLKVFGDIIAYADFFFQDEISYDEKAFDKNLRKPGAAELLARFRDAPGRASNRSTCRTWKQRCNAFVADEGIKTGDIIHAVRVADDRQGRRPRPVRLPGNPRPPDLPGAHRSGTGNGERCLAAD